MLENTHELEVHIFDADGGDAIWIRYCGDDDAWHNILIDGGFIGSYASTFQPVLKAIADKGEIVDLWVITHIDLDHIGAVLGFIKDENIAEKDKLVKNYWFNHAVFKLPGMESKIGFKQGIDLRTYLKSIDKLTVEKITNKTGLVDLNGLSLTILSPTEEKIAAADADWLRRERKMRTKMGRTESDHSKKIEEFGNNPFDEDSDPANGSSITFLLQFKGIKGLLLADGHPSDVVDSLFGLNYTENCPLSLSFIKVAHHGSKKNTSTEFLKLVSTGVYVFTANGITNKHPDKETLARILTHHLSIGQPSKLIFASDTTQIKSLFNVDDRAEERFNFVQEFIKDGQSHVTLAYLPIISK
jgi:beta-lactamase superfamily II metal-dependent hydrolase